MSERPALLVSRYLDVVWNGRDLAAADAFIATDYDSGVLPIRGPQAARQLVEMFAAAFPDFTVVTRDVVAEGDRVVIRYDFRGTHRGEWMGVAPQGVAVDVGGITIYRVSDGKIARTWFCYDALGLMQQLQASQ